MTYLKEACKNKEETYLSGGDPSLTLTMWEAFGGGKTSIKLATEVREKTNRLIKNLLRYNELSSG